MLTHPLFPDVVLVEAADLLTEPPHPELADIRARLLDVLAWAREYLCEPHPELGRRGPVCPYAQGSLDRGVFYLATHRGAVVDADELDGRLAVYRDWFTRLEPTHAPAAQFKTILVTLPDLPAEAANGIVDRAQARLKAAYTAQGLMIGEFHDGPPDKGGLWNDAFRPLRSPVPLLAIRHMVVSDFPFLAGDPTTLTNYLERFADAGPPALREKVAAAALSLGIGAPAPAHVNQGVS